MKNLEIFVKESNHIEGIFSDTEDKDALTRLKILLSQEILTVPIITEFNTAGELRAGYGMDVRVGGHVPPKGCINMGEKLQLILDHAMERRSPYEVHVAFETLHPFMDGNGRTGRAIWLWQMVEQRNYDISMGFLHMYYYQSLDWSRLKL